MMGVEFNRPLTICHGESRFHSMTEPNFWHRVELHDGLGCMHSDESRRTR